MANIKPSNADIVEEVKRVLAVEYDTEDPRVESLASSAIQNFKMSGIPQLPKNQEFFEAYCNLIARSVLPILSENYAQSQFFQNTYNEDWIRMREFFGVNPMIEVGVENVKT